MLSVGKRSSFTPRAADKYYTWDPRAVQALLPHLSPGTRFAEPCSGAGHLVAQLTDAGHICTHMSDLDDGVDALTLPPLGLVITNPPWTRALLHPMIEHWDESWLLFDAAWAYTIQPNQETKVPELLDRCTDIVAVGRLRWIEGTTMDAKDDVAWYHFVREGGQRTQFHPRVLTAGS